MAEIFDRTKTPANSAMFNNRQNYCEMRVEKPTGGLPASPGNLKFSLVVLGGDPITGDEMGDVLAHEIPPLLPSDAPPALVGQYPGISQVPPPKVRNCRKGCLCCLCGLCGPSD